MNTITLPKTSYQKLVRKARVLERVLTLVKKTYPLEEYSEKQIRDFGRLDRVAPGLKKEIISILKEVEKAQ